MNKKKILVFVDWFYPGYKAGGPIRSVLGLAFATNHLFDLHIVTSDRDLNSNAPYEGISIDKWVNQKGANVLYMSPPFSSRSLLNSIGDQSFDFIYTNSFFSYHFGIKILRLFRAKKIKAKNFVIAPRGELHQVRLNIKPFKKLVFLGLVKTIQLYKGVIWHATSKAEVAAIQKRFGMDAIIRRSPNLVEIGDLVVERPIKRKGELNIIFLSRLIQYKNLHGVLDILNEIKLEEDQSINLDVYGPAEDKKYWKTCRQQLKQLENKMEVRYLGIMPHEKVLKTFSKYHLFFFPTYGENYGHVIIESLLAGTPVLISDQTPWTRINDFEGGWAKNLEDKKGFQNVINKVLEMDDQNFSELASSARDFAQENVNTETDILDYQTVFTNN